MQATIERAESLLSHISFTISLLQGEIVNATSSSKTMQRQEISLRIIKAQEDERRRVAREIHDGPAQTLANIVLRLEIAERLLELSPQKAKLSVGFEKFRSANQPDPADNFRLETNGLRRFGYCSSH